jgi:mRNA interferase RelE/StbE
LELGEKMQFVYKGFYRYRIGSYRVIYSVNQEEVLVLVLSVGKRDEIYN